MTQEEKLKEAKRLYKTANSDQRYVLESLFPELKESDDERIKKCIGDIVKEYDWSHIFGVTKDECIAWLEKQGEQKPIERKDFISIPFGTDSEFIKEAIAIPDGCVATIEGRKIFIRKLKP